MFFLLLLNLSRHWWFFDITNANELRLFSSSQKDLSLSLCLPVVRYDQFSPCTIKPQVNKAVEKVIKGILQGSQFTNQ